MRRQITPHLSQCRPEVAGATLHTLGPLVPDGDRCLMLVDVDVTAGAAFAPERLVVLPEAPVFGDCALGALLDEAWIDRADLTEEDVVDVGDVAWTPSAVFAVHRLFRRAPEQPFGVETLGASVVRVGVGGMPVPKPPQWRSHGYRTLAVEADYVYLFDCFGLPDFLLEDCGVLRAPRAEADVPSAYRWLLTDGSWDADPVSRQVVFRSGPQHHVAYHPGLARWVLASVAGFGDTVFVRTAQAPQGPWSDPRDVVACRLPPDDPEAFCDTARLVPALLDPESPRQLVLTYRVDTLAEDKAARIAANPEAYRPAMAWVEM